MSLAKELGIPDVDLMLRSISGVQLLEWMAYAEQAPFGEDRADLRMAILGSFLGNVLYRLHTGKDDSPFEPKDLLPKFEQAPELMSKEDAIAAMDAMFTALVVASAPPKKKELD